METKIDLTTLSDEQFELIYLHLPSKFSDPDRFAEDSRPFVK
jgi:hypothetical protein